MPLLLHWLDTHFLFMGNCSVLLMYKCFSNLFTECYAWWILAIIICIINCNTNKPYTLTSHPSILIPYFPATSNDCTCCPLILPMDPSIFVFSTSLISKFSCFCSRIPSLLDTSNAILAPLHCLCFCVSSEEDISKCSRNIIHRQMSLTSLTLQTDFSYNTDYF